MPIVKVKKIKVEISPGELLDKLTILQIKRERIQDSQKLQDLSYEFEGLSAARDQAIHHSEPLDRLTAELKTVNETLWETEDEIRICAQEKNFGPRFVSLAKLVYQNNDRRAAIKQQINQLLDSRLTEVKSYSKYT